MDLSCYRTRLPSLLLLLGLAACSSESVQSFQGWCEYVHAPTREHDVFSMDTDAIASGLVATWDTIVVENNAAMLDVHTSDIWTNSVVSELRDARMIGAWAEGDTIHFGLGLVLPPPFITSSMSSAEVFGSEYAARLAAGRDRPGESTMDPTTFCLYRGIETFFARLSLHTSDSDATIETEIFERVKQYR